MNRLFCLLSLSLVLLVGQGCTKSKEEKLEMSSKAHSQSALLSNKSSFKKRKPEVLQITPGKSERFISNHYRDFGGANVGSTKPDYFGFIYYDSLSYTITSIDMSNSGAFSKGPGCEVGSYVGDFNCQFEMFFDPTAVEPYTGTIVINYTITNLFSGIPVTGSGTMNIIMEGKGLKRPTSELCPKCAGSIITPTERTIVEEIPLVGTDFNLQYNSRLAPEYITDEGTFTSAFGYNQEGWVISAHKFYDFYAGQRLFDGLGVSSKDYYYDETNDQILITSTNGSEIYVFDADQKHIKTLTFLTGATKYEFNYDSNNLLEEIVDAYGNTTTINRNVNGFITSITAPYGQQTNFTIDGDGKFLTAANPKGETYKLTYKTGTGLLATFQKPGNQVTTLTYDTNGHLIKDLGNSGNFLKFSVGLSGEIIRSSKMGRKATYVTDVSSTGVVTHTITESDSLVTQYTQDNEESSTVTNVIETTETENVNDERLGSLLKRPSLINYTIGGITSSTDFVQTYDPGSGTSLFDYASITNTATTSGRVATSVFDNSSKEMTITSPEGIVSSVKIDSHERPTETKLGSDVAVTFSYDASGRISQSKQGSANQVDYTYNTAGYLETVTNNRSEQVSYLYDLAGQVTQVTLPNLEVIQYQYDGNGKLIAVTPPHKTTHWFSYNSAELLQTYKPATSSYPKSMIYNLDKQLTSFNNSGKTANYNYDVQTAKLSSIQTANGNYTYTYYGSSAPGLVSALQSPYGILNKFTYRGSLLASDKQIKSSDGSTLGQVSFDFDTDHRLTSRTISDSAATTSIQNVVLNDDNQPTQVGDMDLAYDSTSGRLSTTSLDNISDNRTYDSHGNLQSYTARYTPSSAIIYSYTLTRDAMDRIVSISETVGATTVGSDYTYNNRGWLTGVHRSTGGTDDSFTYDYNGNKTSQTVNGVITTSVFDAEDRMTSFGSTTYAYDANGDLKQTTTSLGANSYFTYDVFGSLTQAIPTSGTTYNYIVDGQNRRVGKLVSGTVNRRYLYQDKLSIAAQLNASGVMQKEFVYATGSQTPDYMITASGEYRIIANHLGSPRLVVDASDGTIMQRMDYDVLGSVTADTNADFQPFGFAGGLYDQHTKLLRFGARDYDPGIGRWTAKDPILFDGGDANLYGYVLNDPLNWIDLEGYGPGVVDRPLADARGGGGGPCTSGCTIYVSPNGQAVVAPKGSIVSNTNKGNGLKVNTPDGTQYRLMGPDQKNPQGYGRINNGQYQDINGKCVGSKDPAGHLQPTMPWKGN